MTSDSGRFRAAYAQATCNIDVAKLLPIGTAEKRVTTIKPGAVLLVEDDPTTRGAICAFLELEGYKVTAVSNGREAMNALYAPPRPAVVILDLIMPVMNGWQFRVEQRLHAHLMTIPVIILTAHADGAMYAQAEGLGFVQKPIDPSALLCAVKTFAG